MEREDQSNSLIYKVTIDCESNYVIRSLDQSLPPGWVDAGMQGSITACSTFICTLVTEEGNQARQHFISVGMSVLADKTESIQVDQDLIASSFPLTPMQERFFERNFPFPHHDNIADLFMLEEANPKRVKEAIDYVLRHHDALRLRFIRDGARWRQFVSNSDEIVPFFEIDLSDVPEEKQRSAIEEVANNLQSSLNLYDGPLVRVALFYLGSTQHYRLLIIVHHLASDAISQSIIYQDFETAYTQLSRGETVELPLKTTSLRRWIEQLTRYAQAADFTREADYWLTQSWTHTPSLPMDYSENRDIYDDGISRTIRVYLDIEETLILVRTVPRLYKCQLVHIILAAIAYAISKCTDSETLSIEYVTHGRRPIFDDVDISRTVGWLNTYFLVLLSLRNLEIPKDAIEVVKKEFNSIQRGGIDYSVLSYLSGNKELGLKLRSIPRPDIFFNFFGQMHRNGNEHSLLQSATESAGIARDPRNYIPDINGRNLLYCAGGIFESRLMLAWRYRENQYKETTISALSHGVTDVLRRLVSQL